MASETAPRWDRLADLLPVAAAAWVMLPLLSAWSARWAHPFDLEWMEGGMLAHAWRLQHGLALYPEPGPDWVPYIYPPGYSALLAAVGFVPGLSHALGRLVSLGCTLGAAAVAARLCALRGGGWALGSAAAVAFLGCYRGSGAFYDLVRPDSMGLALVAWALLLAADGRRGTSMASGLLLAAAFVVKHNFAALGVPISLALWARSGWRDGVRFGLSAALPAGAFTLWMQWRSSGRFLTYLLEVPASHPVVLDRALFGTVAEIGAWLWPALLTTATWLVWSGWRGHRGSPWWLWVLAPVAVALGAAQWSTLQDAPKGVPVPELWVVAVSFASIGAAVGAVAAGAGWVVWCVRGQRPPWRWWLAVGCGGGLLVVAALMRGHHGGFLNVLMPAHWAVCAGFGLALASGRAGGGSWRVVLTAAMAAGQLGWIGQRLDTDAISPTAADRDAGLRVVRALRQRCEGPVFSPYAAWLPVQAGLAPSVSLIALWDLRHPDGPLFRDLHRVRDAAESGHWDCVITVAGPQAPGYGVREHYVIERDLEIPPKVLVPKTGWRVRPQQLLVPRPTPLDP